MRHFLIIVGIQSRAKLKKMAEDVDIAKAKCLKVNDIIIRHELLARIFNKRQEELGTISAKFTRLINSINSRTHLIGCYNPNRGRDV